MEKCERCDENISYANLARHNRQAHALLEQFIKCEICSREMVQVKLKYHLKFVHGKTWEPVGNLRYMNIIEGIEQVLVGGSLQVSEGKIYWHRRIIGKLKVNY